MVVKIKRPDCALYHHQIKGFILKIGENETKADVRIDCDDLKILKKIIRNADLNNDLCIELIKKKYKISLFSQYVQKKKLENEPSSPKSLKKSKDNKDSGSRNSLEIPENSLEISENSLEIPENSLEILENTEIVLEFYEIYEKVKDASTDFLLEKMILIEKTYHELIETFPHSFKVIGVYGERKILQRFLQSLFRTNICLARYNGIILIFDRESCQGSLVYLTSDAKLFRKRPMRESTQDSTFVRILSDLCTHVVACVSDRNLEDWYLEINGKLNPYVKAGYGEIRTKLKKQKDYDENAYEIRVEIESKAKNQFVFFSCDSKPTLLFYEQNRVNTKKKPNKVIVEKHFKNIFMNKVTLLKTNTLSQLRGYIFLIIKESNIDFNENTNAVEQVLKLQEKYCNKYLKNLMSFKFRTIQLFKNSDFLIKQRIIQTSVDPVINIISSREIYQKQTKELKEYILSKQFVPIEIVKLNELASLDLSKLDREEQTSQLIQALQSSFEWKKSGMRTIVNWSSIENIFKSFKSNLLKEQKPPLKLYEEKLKALICYKDIFEEPFENLMEEEERKSKEILLRFYEKTLEIIKQEFVFSCGEIELKVNSLPLALYKENITSGKKHLIFKHNFGNEKLYIRQMILTEQVQNICFISILNETLKKTLIIVFEEIPTHRVDYEINEFDDLDLVIASGSNLQIYIIFLNTLKKCYFGHIQDLKFTKSFPIDVYNNDRKNVVCASILDEKPKKMYFLTSNGTLYKTEIQKAKVTKMYLNPQETQSFQSKNGEKFLSFHWIESTKMLAMQTASFLEFYDINFTCFRSIQLSSPDLPVKVVTQGLDIYVLTLVKRSVKCTRFSIKDENFHADHKMAHLDIPLGNPIFDILHIGWSKFGKFTKETSVIKHKKQIGYYSKKPCKKIKQYFLGLADIQSSFKFIGSIDPSNCFPQVKRTKKHVFMYCLVSSIPVHVAAVQNGLLIPLKNSRNNIEEFIREIHKPDSNTTLNIYKSLKFGIQEDEIKKLENLKVFAIIGKQSSGKSYLMNRLFGTRFDVSARRCTEGIWIGLGMIETTHVLVLDCEGLFSSERTASEEMMMCIFLTALSDELIVNSDLSSSKHLIELFDSIIQGSTRLENREKLFQGFINIVYRDIDQTSSGKAQEEYSVFFKKLTSKFGNSLNNIGGRSFINTLYHSFESEEFQKDVEKYRISMLERSTAKDHKGIRFTGEEIIKVMKMLLVQIYLGNFQSTNQLIFHSEFEAKKIEIRKRFEGNFNFADKIGDIVITQMFYLVRGNIEINFNVKDFVYDETDRFGFFMRKLFEKQEIRRFKAENHNLFVEKLENIIQDVLFVWKEEIFTWIKSEYKQISSNSDNLLVVKKELKSYLRELDDFSKKMEICRRVCNSCEAFCIKYNGHTRSDPECNCATSHKCSQKCEMCNDVSALCSSKFEHKEKVHLCKKTFHSCKERCSYCIETCKNQLGHSSAHTCSDWHYCGLPCGNTACQSKCKVTKETISDKHFHNCGNRNCGIDCVFSTIFIEKKSLCDSKCENADHVHSLSAPKIVKHPMTEKDIQIHLCNKKHKCPFKCEKKGICGKTHSVEMKMYRAGTIPFTYIREEEVNKYCDNEIEKGKVKHENNPHVCEVNVHTCKERCPDCLALCDAEYGHHEISLDKYNMKGSKENYAEFKMHRAKHRTKENIVFVADYQNFNKNFEYFTEEKGKTTTCTVDILLKAGDTGSPEICEFACKGKGRGHMHPIECKGRSLCKKNCSDGIHKTLIIDNLGNTKDFDLVSCITYWNIKKWKNPMQHMPEALALFEKCSAYCLHSSHGPIPTIENLCTQKIFHKGPHIFDCRPHGTIKNDIIFILDSTKSMEWTIEKVKEIVISLTKKWSDKKLDNKFAIIDYTDHDIPGRHLADEPYGIFPLEGKLKHGDSDKVIEYIPTIECSGGSRPGEALIDGLFAATKLKLRKSSSVLYILICDDTPHGTEFHEKLTAPCKCGKDWNQILQIMKNTRMAKFFLVSLDVSLNKTIELFGLNYGENFKALDLTGLSAYERNNVFVSGIEEKINECLQNNYEYSLQN